MSSAREEKHTVNYIMVSDDTCERSAYYANPHRSALQRAFAECESDA